MDSSSSSRNPRFLSSRWLKWEPARRALRAREIRVWAEGELDRLGWPWSAGVSALLDQMRLVEEAAPLATGARR